MTDWLECPCCGDSVFESEDAIWGMDEQEVCSCGCRVTVRVDEHDDPPTADAVIIDGDEVPHDRAALPKQDWAEERAREWLAQWESPIDMEEDEQGDFQRSLTALLRDVSDARDRDWRHKMDTEGRDVVAAGMRGLLAEVRRVVEDVRFRWETHAVAPLACDEILSRLEKLGSPRVEDLLDGLPRQDDSPNFEPKELHKFEASGFIRKNRLSTPEEALKVMGQGQPLVKMREIK